MIKIARNVKGAICRYLFWLFILWAVIFNIALAQTEEPQKNEPQSRAKVQKKATGQDKAATVSDLTKSGQEKNAIDWGDWDRQPSPRFGVGIQGEIEAQINVLDQSNLLENASGVATVTKDNNNQQGINHSQGKKLQSKDFKKMMAELEAMEAKVKKEIEDDTEF